MARKLVVEIVGDSQSLQRSFRQSSNAAKVFESDVAKSARGAVSASLSFRGLGRAAAYASGYLIGGAGLAIALKDVTKAAVEHQAAQAQLASAVTHSGASYQEYAVQINATLKAQRDLAGFTENETDAAFTKLLRTTQSVSAALRDTNLAMEIARGAGIDLSRASDIVNKTLAGQTTGLRRLGVELPKGVSAYRALQIAGQKYAGAIAAFTGTAAGAQARLTNAIHETEITIGTALLPTITKLSNEIADWLNKSDNQKRLQQDVNTVLRDGTAIVKDLTAVIKTASDAVGGFSNLVKILIGLKVAKTLLEWRAATVAFGAAAGTAGAAGAVGALYAAVSRLAAIGAVSIAIRFPGLAAGLAGLLSVPGAIAAATAAAVLASSGAAPNVSGIPKAGRASFVAGLASHGDIPKSILLQAAKAGGIDPNTPAGNALKNPKVVAYLYSWAAQHGLLPQIAGGAGAEAAAKAAAGKARSAVAAAGGATGSSSSATAPLDRLSQIQDQVARARLAVAQGTKGAQAELVAALKAEIDFDKKYAAIQEQLAAQGGKDAKKHSQTAQALIASETSDLNEITALTAKHTVAAKKKTKAATAAVGFSVPLGLQLAAAQAGAISGNAGDLSAARAIKAYAEKVLRSGKATLQTQIDAWNEIATQNATIASILGNIGKRTVHSVVTSAEQIVKGIHFASTADKVAAEARIAQAQAHGGRIPNVQGVGGQPIIIHSPVYLDGKKIADNSVYHQQRAGAHAAVQTRGPQAGRNARVH